VSTYTKYRQRQQLRRLFYSAFVFFAYGGEYELYLVHRLISGKLFMKTPSALLLGQAKKTNAL